jgi:cytochrome c biogenesis protein CcmG/thiol:disulfide interchange protein DsbE
VPSLLLGAAVVVMAIVLVLRSDMGSPPVVRGGTAPPFELPKLAAAETPVSAEAAKFTLSSLSGRVVLLNFWATWCEPCEREMPAMERLYQALPREEFELVAVAIDDKESDVRAFQERYRLSFPILLDLDQAVYGGYQTMGVPESLLIDRDGRIVERYVGPREWDATEYVERIRELIGGAERIAAPGSRQAATGSDGSSSVP